MFRFWNTESRTSKESTTVTLTNPPDPIAHVTATRDVVAQPLKRSHHDGDHDAISAPPLKRLRQEEIGPSGLAPCNEQRAQCSYSTEDNVQTMRDHIEQILGTEILTKHQEKRLIDMELAKCQIALEQLRRCHLIPFPTHKSTPSQRVEITNGNGPAIRSKPDGSVPQWAPPFGVVDGPYARHYAQWLLPHSSFDGSDGNWQYVAEAAHAFSTSSEGRTTRNSVGDVAAVARGRSARGTTDLGQNSQIPTMPRNEPKKKPGPCIIKRSDGQWVKLVCVTCNREDFSSTQGFINHCRIAHKNEFKSHEEAAVKCGQPIDKTESRGNVAGEDTPSQNVQSAVVHPFARQDISEQEAYIALRSRIAASMELLRQGKLPGVKDSSRLQKVQPRISTLSLSKSARAASEAPHLSRLLQLREFDGNFNALLEDVKTAVPIDDLSPGEESDDGTPVSDSPMPRLPVVKRVPARSGQSPMVSSRPISHKGLAGAADDPPHEVQDATQTPDQDADMEESSLSPNTGISNNAPSLVSDDGEYDSDEGSSVSSQSITDMDDESVSDVAEISLDDEHDSRVLRRTSTGVSSAVRFRRDDPKHVSFVGPMAGGRNDKRRYMA
jgi:ADA HAT complex component 1